MGKLEEDQWFYHREPTLIFVFNSSQKFNSGLARELSTLSFKEILFRSFLYKKFPLEVIFELVKNNADIKGITIFGHAFLYNACAGDLTFSLNDLSSVKNLINTFKVFSIFRD